MLRSTHFTHILVATPWFSWELDPELPLDLRVCREHRYSNPFEFLWALAQLGFHVHLLPVVCIQDSSSGDCPQDPGSTVPSCTGDLEIMFIQAQSLKRVGINYTPAFHGGKGRRHPFLDSSWNIPLFWTLPKITSLLVFLPILVFLSGFF